MHTEVYTLKRSRLRDGPVSFGDSPFQFTSGVPDWEGEAGEPWGHTREEMAPGRERRDRSVATRSRGLCAASARNPGERQDPEGRAGRRPYRGWVLGSLAVSPTPQRVLCPQQAPTELAGPPHLPERHRLKQCPVTCDRRSEGPSAVLCHHESRRTSWRAREGVPTATETERPVTRSDGRSHSKERKEARGSSHT